jgi:hypothetical protein
MSSPRGLGHPNDRAMQEELSSRIDLGIEDIDDDALDLSELAPPPGQHGTEGGDRRKQKTVRMGKRWSEIVQHIEDGDYTWEEFAASLHPRELARGQLFDSRGGFSGRPPKLVPSAFHAACIRELMKRGRRMYQENYLLAIEAMTKIATSPEAKAADRLKAAQFVIERLEGKVPDRIEVVQAAPWEEMISGLIAEVSEDVAIQNAQEYLERRKDASLPD